jgi:Septin
MIDPTSVISTSARQASSFSPTKTRSETTISYRPPDLSSVSADDSSSESEDEDNDKLCMSPAELRVIRRLTARANVLPVIARADSLTDERLTAVKLAVRRELRDAGLDFGVFGPPDFDKSPAQNGHGIHMPPAGDNDADLAGDGRKSRTVIKLRPNRRPNAHRSRSRSRIEHSDAGDDEPLSLDNDSIASVRFSAQIVARMDLSDLLPFALIAPEQVPKRSFKELRMSSYSESIGTDNDSSAVSPSDDGHDRPQSGGQLSSGRPKVMPPYNEGPPADLKGMFLRKFRWGTVDVLDPNHCDFAALRTAVLSTHMKVKFYRFPGLSETVLTNRRCLKSGRRKSYTRNTELRNSLQGGPPKTLVKRKLKNFWLVSFTCR